MPERTTAELYAALTKFQRIVQITVPLAQRGERISDKDLATVKRLHEEADSLAGEYPCRGNGRVNIQKETSSAKK